MMRHAFPRAARPLRRGVRIGGAALAAWACMALVLAPSAWAQKASDAYLRLTDAAASVDGSRAPAQAALALSVALKDVDAALDQLDADGDRELTWGEVRQSLPAIVQWAGSGMGWHCGGAPATPVWRFDALEQRSDGRYVRLASTLDCAPPATVALRYRLLEGIDPTHRLLVAGVRGGQPLAAVLAPGAPAATELLPAVGGMAPKGVAPAHTGAQTHGSGLATLVQFAGEGVKHLLEGYDHLAFLLALLLPLALARPAAGHGQSVGSAAVPSDFLPRGAPTGRAALAALVLTVTCFTVGHSITLALAGLGWVTVSGGWVEPVIAISIGISALLNLFPVPGLRGHWLALGFGLVHGLGFSGVLMEAGISGGLMAWALAGFNLGVEAGQLMVVALWCAASLVLSRWALYRPVVVRGGSAALVVLSLYWTVQRLASAG